MRFFVYNYSLNSSAFSLWPHPCPLLHGKHTPPFMQPPCLIYISREVFSWGTFWCSTLEMVFSPLTKLKLLHVDNVDDIFHVVDTSGFACPFGPIPFTSLSSLNPALGAMEMQTPASVALYPLPTAHNLVNCTIKNGSHGQ